MPKERKEKNNETVKVIVKVIKSFVTCTAVAFTVFGLLAFVGSKLMGTGTNWWVVLRTSLIVGCLTVLITTILDRRK